MCVEGCSHYLLFRLENWGWTVDCIILFTALSTAYRTVNDQKLIKQNMIIIFKAMHMPLVKRGICFWYHSNEVNFSIGGHANPLCIQDCFFLSLLRTKSHVFFRIITITVCCLLSSSMELFSVLSMAYLWPVLAALWWLAQGAVSTSGLHFWSCLGWRDCAIAVAISWNIGGMRYHKLIAKEIT